MAKCAGEAAMIRAVDGDTIPALISNGVDPEVFQPGKPVPDAGPLRLICVGRLIERKGQRYLIEAVKRLVDEGLDIELELVGIGDGQAAISSRVLELGLAGRVKLSGYVPRDEIAGHYAAAHVFVLPSYNEGMSVATLEAMAAGLPIVATRTGGTMELISDEVNGFTFEWADTETLVRFLRRLATNRALARRMGAVRVSGHNGFRGTLRPSATWLCSTGSWPAGRRGVRSENWCFSHSAGTVGTQ